MVRNIVEADTYPLATNIQHTHSLHTPALKLSMSHPSLFARCMQNSNNPQMPLNNSIQRSSNIMHKFLFSNFLCGISCHAHWRIRAPIILGILTTGNLFHSIAKRSALDSAEFQDFHDEIGNFRVLITGYSYYSKLNKIFAI